MPYSNKYFQISWSDCLSVETCAQQEVVALGTHRSPRMERAEHCNLFANNPLIRAVVLEHLRASEPPWRRGQTQISGPRCQFLPERVQGGA